MGVGLYSVLGLGCVLLWLGIYGDTGRGVLLNNFLLAVGVLTGFGLFTMVRFLAGSGELTLVGFDINWVVR